MRPRLIHSPAGFLALALPRTLSSRRLPTHLAQSTGAPWESQASGGVARAGACNGSRADTWRRSRWLASCCFSSPRALAATGDLTQPAGTAGCISEDGVETCADGHGLGGAYSRWR